MKQESKIKIDIALLIIFLILATAISLYAKAPFLISTLLFFGLPGAWLSYRHKKAIAKTAIFSLIFSVPLGIIIDYIATSSNAWHVPSTLFAFRLFGIIPIEDFIWGFLFFYAIIMFYEYFLDKKDSTAKTNIKYYISIMAPVLLLVIATIIIRPSIFVISYAYLWIGVVFIILPILMFFVRFPKLIKKFIITGVYFLAVTLLHEFTGLQLDHWQFSSGQFIGWINLGTIKIPAEEFIFFISLAAMSVLAYYEYFDDDRI